MRVELLTLTTASAAALTIGLASPALGEAFQTDAQAGLHQRTQHVTVHPGTLVRGDDDGDDDGDGGGGDDGVIGRDRGRRHRFTRFLPFAFGDEGCDGASCGDGGGDDDEGPDCCFGGGGGGGGGHKEVVRRVRGRVMHMGGGQVAAVPRGGVPTGFGGSQGISVPMGVAGLSLILGGTGLLARRRIRTGARS